MERQRGKGGGSHANPHRDPEQEGAQAEGPEARAPNARTDEKEADDQEATRQHRDDLACTVQCRHEGHEGGAGGDEGEEAEHRPAGSSRDFRGSGAGAEASMRGEWEE